MSPADDDIAFYNRALVDLSARAGDVKTIDSPTHAARASSPICGSVVTVALAVGADGRVGAFGYELEACALTRAVVAVMQAAVIGADLEEIRAAHAALAAMLEGGAASWPNKKWEEMNVLAPLRDHRVRHNAMQLPFEAAEKALTA
jgi:NifU-like protein involved in Fe-S cluster formation